MPRANQVALSLLTSVTPEYLVKLGFIKEAPDASKDIGLLLDKALEKIAFLPFGLMIDQWRWKVFSGEIPPEKYNQAWWDLRLMYQGVAPPAARFPRRGTRSKRSPREGSFRVDSETTDPRSPVWGRPFWAAAALLRGAPRARSTL